MIIVMILVNRKTNDMENIFASFILIIAGIGGFIYNAKFASKEDLFFAKFRIYWVSLALFVFAIWLFIRAILALWN